MDDKQMRRQIEWRLCEVRNFLFFGRSHAKDFPAYLFLEQLRANLKKEEQRLIAELKRLKTGNEMGLIESEFDD